MNQDEIRDKEAMRIGSLIYSFEDKGIKLSIESVLTNTGSITFDNANR